jgi:hypothetical protein
MAGVNRDNSPPIKRTTQYTQNWGFDEEFNMPATELIGYDGTNLQRVKTDTAGRLLAGLTPGTDYDYLDVQQTSATVETYVFKTGGSGGTTVRTIVVTYTSSSKSDIDTVEWS